MDPTHQQLTALVARAFPGETLSDVRELSRQRYALMLSCGEPVYLELYGSDAEATSAATALGMLANEFDLPIPRVPAADLTGVELDRPALLFAGIRGEPLARVLPLISEEQLYTLGRHVGEVMFRIHRLACGHYGDLAAASSVAETEHAYVLARLERDLAPVVAAGRLDDVSAAMLRDWFEHSFRPPAPQAALIHAGLSPETILVRHSSGAWRLSGLLGWGQAVGWSPSWEHATFLDSIGAAQFFPVRVGYGNSYDEQTKRSYEQVRELALAPYRALLALERLHSWAEQGEPGSHEHEHMMLRVLIGMIRHEM